MFASLLGFVLLCQATATLPSTTQDDKEENEAAREEPRRYRIGADFDWSFSNAEDYTPLNLTYYGNDILQLLRVSLLFNFRVSDRVGLYLNFTSENADTPHVYGAFVRLAPWGGKKLWFQAGKIPPAFGAFPERWYPAANPLVGDPLMYSYETSLRADNIPADADDLLSQRGMGASPEFQGGGVTFPRPGMAMVEIFRWDSGVMGFGAVGRFEYVAGVTNGTLSNPLVEDDNDGNQILGRLRFRPSPAFNAGVSAARGPYLDKVIEDSLDDQSLGSFHQTTVGGDINYARGHVLLYAEAGWSRWESPNIDQPLEAVSAFFEARYRFFPGVYAAGRLDRLSFNDIAAGNGERTRWEFPVTRLEIGAGYSFDRHVVLKLVGQFNRYDEASALDEDIIAFQIVVHF